MAGDKSYGDSKTVYLPEGPSLEQMDILQFGKSQKTRPPEAIQGALLCPELFPIADFNMMKVVEFKKGVANG